MTKLHRSSTDKKLGGICGGLGEIYDIDPTIVRLGVVFLGLVTAFLPVVITYIVGWAIIPEGKPLNDQVKDPPSAQ
jgi:phage shock protein C